MSDIYDGLKSVKTKSDVVKDQKVARFAYNDAAYAGDDAVGKDAYDYYENQNVPSAGTTNLDPMVLDKGLTAQGASLPRRSMNHFFGRVSYNLNKLHDWFNSVLSNIIRSEAMNGNRYSPTAEYQTNDTCTFVDPDSAQKVRMFVRTSTTPGMLVGSAPMISGSVNTAHWRELYSSMDDLSGHAGLNVEGTHGSTVVATANRLVHRDANGRAQIVDPEVAADIASKGYVDAQINSDVNATANTLVKRDSNGRSKIADPEVAADISNRGYVDMAIGGIGHLTPFIFSMVSRLPYRKITEYVSAGSFTFTPTAGCVFMAVVVTGAGGGSGSARYNATVNSRGRAGGGGGPAQVAFMRPPPAGNVSVAVGAGGIAGPETNSNPGTSAAGGQGGPTTFDDVTVPGGGGGAKADTNQAGQGGLGAVAPTVPAGYVLIRKDDGGNGATSSAVGVFSAGGGIKNAAANSTPGSRGPLSPVDSVVDVPGSVGGAPGLRSTNAHADPYFGGAAACNPDKSTMTWNGGNVGSNGRIQVIEFFAAPYEDAAGSFNMDDDDFFGGF